MMGGRGEGGGWMKGSVIVVAVVEAAVSMPEQEIFVNTAMHIVLYAFQCEGKCAGVTVCSCIGNTR